MTIFKLSAFSLTVLAFTVTGCQSSGNSGGNSSTSEDISIESTTDSMSYVLGKNMHENFSQQGIEINEELVAKALKDAANERDTLIAEEKAKPLMQQFQQKVMQKRREQMQQRRQGQGGQGGQSPQGGGGQGGQRQQQLKEKLKKKLEEQQQKQSGDGSSDDGSQQ